MNRKKILFISNIAGKKIGSFSLASIKASQQVGLEFHIASNFDAESIEQRQKDEQEYEIKIHHIDFVRNPLHPQNRNAYKQLVKLMKQEKFDIVHCNTPVGGVFGRLAAKKCGIKRVIYQAHGFHFYKGSSKLNWLIYYPIERMLAHITDKLITINKEDFEQAKKFHLRGNGKVYYVPGVGIDTNAYKNLHNNSSKIKKSLNLEDTDIICISVGRLDANKNNSTIIRAIALLSEMNVHLIICGSGEQEQKLKDLAKELNVEQKIHFLGNQSDMSQFYQISDIFVMASFREGLSRSIMEAMASGISCVVSKIRGNIDLIQDGNGGFYANPHNPEEYAEKIKLLGSKKVREEMGNYNLGKIKEFSIEKVEARLTDIYQEIIE